LAKKGRQLAVRRVTSADERNRSQFLTLPKVGDTFQGTALFTPDPELDDNPGYFEYFDHWDTKETSYIPCAGPDMCPFCKANDRPSTRAKTLWLVDDEVKVFTINWSMINEFSDMLSEDETVLGESFRIKRLDDRGKYRISPKGKGLSKKELKALLEGDNLPDLEDLLNAQLRRAYEDIDVAAAMEADDDDDETEEDEEPKARRGKAKSKKAEPEPGGDDLEDLDVTITSVSKAKDQIKVEDEDEETYTLEVGENDVTDFKKGMEITVSAEYDEDEEEYTLGEWSEQDEEPEEDEEPEGEAELPDEIEGDKFEIVNVDADEETLDVKSDDLEFTLYFLDEGEAADVDFDEYEEGDTVVIHAVKDKDGDMVATEVPTKPKTRAKKKTTAGKGKKK
jgi:hypothetical protein